MSWLQWLVLLVLMVVVVSAGVTVTVLFVRAAAARIASQISDLDAKLDSVAGQVEAASAEVSALRGQVAAQRSSLRGVLSDHLTRFGESTDARFDALEGRLDGLQSVVSSFSAVFTDLRGRAVSFVGDQMRDGISRLADRVKR